MEGGEEGGVHEGGGGGMEGGRGKGIYGLGCVRVMGYGNLF